MTLEERLTRNPRGILTWNVQLPECEALWCLLLSLGDRKGLLGWGSQWVFEAPCLPCTTPDKALQPNVLK